MMTPLKLARSIEGMRQVELSKRLKIHNTTLSLLECGWRELTPEQLTKIKKILPSYNRAVEILNGGEEHGREKGSREI